MHPRTDEVLQLIHRLPNHGRRIAVAADQRGGAVTLTLLAFDRRNT